MFPNLKNEVKVKSLRTAICDLGKLSDKNLLRVMGTLEKFSPNYKNHIQSITKLINENHPGKELINKVLKETNKNCRNKLIENLILREVLLNRKIREEIKDEGSYSPATVLISPTMRCNLKCTGCYAGNYTREDDLELNTLERIVSEAEDMGCAFFTILGGEPFIYQNLFKIFEKYNKNYFQVFTNGTLINKDITKKLLDVGNVMPMVSIEGFRERTDERRGRGVYNKLMEIMNFLKEDKIPFGFSTTVTNKNAGEVTSNKFIDSMIENGAYVGWFFLYMPIGRNPDLSSMPTPKQRLMMLDRITNLRQTKPIFLIDFWNDAPYVGGCIAAKDYIHITSKGDVEPCIFTHFAMDNVKDKPLREVMDSKYFREIRKRQPYNENLYLPCMWIDNPEVSRELYETLKIHPTHQGAEEILINKHLKRGIDKYSKEVKQIYEEVWENKNLK